MGILTTSIPIGGNLGTVPRFTRCFIEDENGIFVEVRVRDVLISHGVGDPYEVQMEITGSVHLPPSAQKKISPEQMHKMLTGDMVSAGGLPPEVALRCPACSHLNQEMHTCRSE